MVILEAHPNPRVLGFHLLMSPPAPPDSSLVDLGLVRDAASGGMTFARGMSTSEAGLLFGTLEGRKPRPVPAYEIGGCTGTRVDPSACRDC